IHFLQSQPNIIQTIEQTMFAESIYFKREGASSRANHYLLLKVDQQLVSHACFHLIKQGIDFFCIQYDRQNAVLEAIVIENISIAWRNNAAKTIIQERPRRMFATRTTTKVLTRQQNARALIAWLIQHKVRIQGATCVVPTRFTLVEIAPFIEGIRAKAGTLDRFKELLRNDGIGIDICTIQRRHQSI